MWNGLDCPHLAYLIRCVGEIARCRKVRLAVVFLASPPVPTIDAMPECLAHLVGTEIQGRRSVPERDVWELEAKVPTRHASEKLRRSVAIGIHPNVSNLLTIEVEVARSPRTPRGFDYLQLHDTTFLVWRLDCPHCAYLVRMR